MKAPRMRLRLLVAAMLAAGTAHGDGGPAHAPGNALNPAPLNPSTAGRWMDDEGLGTRIPAARSPNGQLYNVPLEPGEEDDRPKSERRSVVFIEAGGIGTRGDDRAQGFRNYRDWSNGFYLNDFALGVEQPDSARYFEAVGGAVGRDDQFYRFQLGRYNAWKITAFYDGIPQVLTTTYRSLWSGLGTGSLTLNSLTPGGAATAAATQANVLAALAATPDSELQVLRKRAGARFDVNMGEAWKAYASFTTEKREGSRPFGAVFGGGGGGGNMEVAETIDYQTHDLAAGLQYNDLVNSFNLRASASFFRNDVDAMAFQNPLYISLNGSSGLSPRSFTQGRFDLAPGNEHYNLRGEYGRALPDFFRGNFTAVAAVGTMRQDDKLVAPTLYPLTGGTVTAGGASLANVWNTTDALTRDSADARIDTRLVDLGLSLTPSKGLGIKGKLRYYETDNASQYVSCNPLTGQWGRILNDGSGLSLAGASTTMGANPAGTSANAYNAARCDLAAVQALALAPASGNIPIRSVPSDYTQVNASLAGDYRLGRGSSLTALLEREGFRREYRERERTWEDRVKLGYTNGAAFDGTVRVTYEHARRTGSEYDVGAFDPFFSVSMGPTPAANGVAMQNWIHTIAQFRSFDLADRRQNILNGRVNYAFDPTLDAALTLQVKDADYPASYGRSGQQRSNSLTLDVNYQAGAKGELYAFYAYQSGTMNQAGVSPNACVLGSTYYFYSDGQVLAAAAGAAAPATPAGTTLVARQNVVAANWREVCGGASATSPLFPESRGWQARSRDRNDMLGVGFKYDLGRAKLDASFSRTLGRTRIGYAFNPAALGLSALQAGLAGDGFSDLFFAQNVLSASVVVPLNKDISMRMLVRHETGKLRDWHYDGVAEGPMPTSNSVYLDAGPQDYRATLLGLFFQVRL